MATKLSSISGSYIVGDDLEGKLEQPVATLCGRTDEVMQLLDAYHRVITNQNSEVVVVHGETGSGKTTLVEILRKTTVESNGYYVIGKYFQDLGIQEPYSAIMAAFSDLCDLVSQSDDFENRQPVIQQALGEDSGWLLSRTISHLSPFLSGSFEEEGSIKNEVALAKFTVACKSFLRAMACTEHPVVLVIDDIHWMDMGSRRLLEVLLSDTELKNVLLVLIYRDEEEELALDLLHTLKSSNLGKVDIPVGGLDAGGIHQIILSRFSMEASDKSEALSLLVHQRTLGNAFHVLGFLDFIESEGLLDLEAGIDVEAIKQRTGVVDTIADMLLRKIHRLSSGVHETMKIASLLGFRFEKDLIADVMSLSYSLFLSHSGGSEEDQDSDRTMVSVIASLESAANSGMIEKTSDGYQFCHDKFQSCFRSMIDPSAEPHIHKMIGETLLKYDSPKSRYHAAVHLNRAMVPLVEEGFDLTELARTNLEAAKYCKSMSFFFEATQLLKVALSLVPESDKWETHYNLTLEISNLLATMTQCIGELPDSQRVSRSILDNAKYGEDKLDAITVYFTTLGIEGRLEESVAFCMQTLKDFGVVVPSKVSLVRMMCKLFQVNMLLAQRSDDDITNSLMVPGKSTCAVISLLTAISSTYLVLRGKEKEGAYFSLLALHITLQEGLSSYSALAFATYSAMQMGLGKYEKAVRYGELALKIGREHNSTRMMDVVVIVTLLVSHWNQPLENIAKRLDQSAIKSFESGDATPRVAVPLWFHLLAGEHLGEIERLHRWFHSTIRDLQRDDITGTLWMLPSYQYVLNLRSENAKSWRDLTELTGDIMKESDYVVRALQATEDSLWTILWKYKLQLEFHFGFHSAAEKTFENLKPYVLTTALSYHMHAVMIVAFIGSLNFYAQSRERMQGQNLRKARRYKRHIEKLKLGSRPNILPLIAILEAEDLSHQKRTDAEVLAHHFDKAIEANAMAGFVHMEALANERAGFAFGHRGDWQRAEVFFERAVNLYGNAWGAKNKAAWLTEKSAQILKRLKKDGDDGSSLKFSVDTIQVSPENHQPY